MRVLDLLLIAAAVVSGQASRESGSGESPYLFGFSSVSPAFGSVESGPTPFGPSVDFAPFGTQSGESIQSAPAGSPAFGSVESAPTPSGPAGPLFTNICYNSIFAEPAADPAFVMEEEGAGYAIKKLQTNVWGIMSGGYNSLLVTGNKHALLIDVGPENADHILKAVTSVLGPNGTLTHLLYGHVHHDHIGGASKVKAAYPNVKIIASAATTNALKALNSPSRPLPDIVLTNLTNGLQAGGVDYQFTALASHGPDHMIVMVDGKTAFAADLLNPGYAPFFEFGFTNNFDLGAYKQDLRTLRDMKWQVFMPGHSNRPGTREDIQLVLDYTDSVIAKAGYALSTIDYYSTVTRTYLLNQANAFGLGGYRVFFSEVSMDCERQINGMWYLGNQTWTEQNFRSVDVVSNSHCWAALWYLNLYAPEH